jgi:hypothetical protein
MPPSTTSLFPDINVWVALTYEGHVHHAAAAAWFAELRNDGHAVLPGGIEHAIRGDPRAAAAL